MIALPAGVKVWLVAGATDMRKGFDGLAALVQMQLTEDPFSGQAALNSIMLHELKHTVQDSMGGAYKKQPAAERMRREKEAYELQWSLRDDPRFTPNDGVRSVIVRCRAAPENCYQ